MKVLKVKLLRKEKSCDIIVGRAQPRSVGEYLPSVGVEQLA